MLPRRPFLLYTVQPLLSTSACLPKSRISKPAWHFRCSRLDLDVTPEDTVDRLTSDTIIRESGKEAKMHVPIRVVQCRSAIRFVLVLSYTRWRRFGRMPRKESSCS